MWYYCRDRAFPKDVADTLGSGRIALATSVDGIQWSRFAGPGYGGALVEPSTDPAAFDCTHIGVLDALYVEGCWYLCYFGGDRRKGFTAIPDQMGYRMRPGLLVSNDGVSFSRVKGSAPGGAAVDLDGNVFAAWPNGIHDGEKFVLYYTTLRAPGEEFVTQVAFSYDAVRWHPQGRLTWADSAPDHEAKGMMTRHVLRNPLPGGERWLMVYTAIDGSPELRRSVGLAGSKDGLEWRRLRQTPLFEAGDRNAWDGGGVAIPQLVDAGDELRLYYFGFPHKDGKSADIPKGIGLAVDRSRTLGHFERVRF